jgi:serine/threonine protein kinase
VAIFFAIKFCASAGKENELFQPPERELEADELSQTIPQLLTGQSVGAYKILALLGRGGMGVVYRARDERLRRDVAIKVLPAFANDADRLRRFEQEARATSALNHPNILTIYHIGTQDGAPFIVAELLEGEELRAQLESGALPVRRALEYAQQIAAGLAAAHTKGIRSARQPEPLCPQGRFAASPPSRRVLYPAYKKLPSVLSARLPTVRRRRSICETREVRIDIRMTREDR